MEDMRLSMQKALDRFGDESKKVRSGRAVPSMLEGVMVEVYGAPTPLNHIANTTAPDAVSLMVSPFDPSNVEAIADAIRKDENLGLNPTDDGRVVRIPMPPMTEESRRDAVKRIGVLAEDAKIAMRQARQAFMKTQQDDKKAGVLSEDDLKSAEKNANDVIGEFQDKLDQAAKAKEQEIMTI